MAIPEGKSRRVQAAGGGISKVQQSDIKRTNINSIMSRYARTGYRPPNVEGHYGDFTNVGDYHSCLEAVRHAQMSFDALPAAVRKEFRNDPGRLLKAIDDPGQRDRLYELGVFERPPTPPVEPEAVTPEEPS